MFFWLTGKSEHKPWLLELRSSKTFIVITVATAVFSDIFVYALVVPVFPFVLTERAGIEPDRIQTWISVLLAAYGAALFAASPFCGWLSDRISSRRTPLILGLIVLAASTAMLMVGNSIGVMIAGRVIQGISSAVVWVAGMALLVDTVGTTEIGQAMGYVGISMSLAVLLAPLLGGVVYARAGYYAVFAMAFGLIALDVFLRFFMIERKQALQWLSAEAVAEQAVIAASLTPDAGALAPEQKEDDTVKTEGQDIAAVDIEAIDSPTEEKSPKVEPTAPVRKPKRIDKYPPIIRLCTSQRFVSALFGSLMNAALLSSFDATLPLFVSHTFGWDSIGAGVIFLPLVLATFIGPLVGFFSDKYGPRWIVIAGFLLNGPFLIFLRFVSYNSLGQKVLLCALLALIGVALTLVLTPLMAELAYLVAEKERREPPGYYGKNGAYAQAYSLFNMSWALGMFLGPLLGGLVNESSGWANAYLILGCISMATTVPMAVYTGGNLFKIWRRKRREPTTTA